MIGVKRRELLMLCNIDQDWWFESMKVLMRIFCVIQET
jgi:hypothetical protein